MLDRHDLTDEEWARLEPLLPDRSPRRGGRWVDHRLILNGVFWRTRTGSPWRNLPGEYGHVNGNRKLTSWRQVKIDHLPLELTRTLERAAAVVGDGGEEPIMRSLAARALSPTGNDWLP